MALTKAVSSIAVAALLELLEVMRFDTRRSAAEAPARAFLQRRVAAEIRCTGSQSLAPAIDDKPASGLRRLRR